MDPEKFRESLQNRQPEPGLNLYLQALWWDARGDWKRAHTLIQDLPEAPAARIHAYLHRKEGDQGNALYWYRRAGTEPFRGGLHSEWEELVRELGF